MPRTGPGEPPVYQVTDAATAHSDDLDSRITKYLVSMFIRTLCVLLVFVVDGWLRWVFAAGAIALPYVAVILANNSGARRGRPDRPGAPARTALGATAAPAGRGAGDPPPVLLTGVVQPREGDAGTAGPAADRLRDTA